VSYIKFESILEELRYHVARLKDNPSHEPIIIPRELYDKIKEESKEFYVPSEYLPDDITIFEEITAPCSVKEKKRKKFWESDKQAFSKY
jgi:hypothetical protein